MLKYRGRPTLKSFDQAIPSLAEILIRDIPSLAEILIRNIPSLAEIFFFSTLVPPPFLDTIKTLKFFQIFE